MYVHCNTKDIYNSLSVSWAAMKPVQNHYQNHSAGNICSYLCGRILTLHYLSPLTPSLPSLQSAVPHALVMISGDHHSKIAKVAENLAVFRILRALKMVSGHLENWSVNRSKLKIIINTHTHTHTQKFSFWNSRLPPSLPLSLSLSLVYLLLSFTCAAFFFRYQNLVDWESLSSQFYKPFRSHLVIQF